jgi:hypothetical protein
MPALRTAFSDRNGGSRSFSTARQGTPFYKIRPVIAPNRLHYRAFIYRIVEYMTLGQGENRQAALSTVSR